MKRYIISIITLLALSFSLFAQQDARQRTVATVVSDVLAAMPAQNITEYETNMLDLAKFAPQSVEVLGSMLTPAEQGKNSRIEYALGGVAAYASTSSEYKAAVTEGFKAAVAAQQDQYNRQFLEAQLRLLGVAPAMAPLKLEPVMKPSKVLKALKSSNRSTRVIALRRSETYANDAFYAKVAKAKKAEGAEADVLYWLGERRAASQLPYILAATTGKYAADAREAAAKIGGADAAEQLCSILKSEKCDELMYFNGDFSKELAAVAENADAATLARVLDVANRRHMTEFVDYAFNAGAYDALPGLVSESDAARLAELLDKCDAKAVPAVSRAYELALSSSAKFYETVAADVEKATNKERFYSALAATNTDEAVKYLADRYHDGSHEAISCLGRVTNVNAADVIFEHCSKEDAYIPRYVDLTNRASLNELQKAERYAAAMKLAKNPVVKEIVLNAMATVVSPEMLKVVDTYLDDPDAAHAAALSAKKIMAGCEFSIASEALSRYAERAIKVFAAAGAADDEYAISELKTLLENHKVYPVSELTAEEKAMGFEMLYDGTNLDKWIGDKDGYVSVDGVINVFAHWGLTSGNLYTAKEYRNFIYRFEFLFLEGGVNNGVGIRTPMGVDAAFDGMCECQILDHDDPIYGGLADYQVHGSAYGIIPAKRLVHKPIGQWSYEEIEVRENHIKVTVNGEVILDGDLSEACQGHNVAPDGSTFNPYMVDHRNHPGMFNYKGHISFCGHGKGLQFRNVRILDLGE